MAQHSNRQSLPTLPPISTLPALPDAQKFQVVDHLFEPSEDLHNLSQSLLDSKRATQYTSYAELISAVQEQLLSLLHTGSPAQLDAILGAHPRLGSKTVDSALSRAEQAHLQHQHQITTKAVAEEAQALAALNERYEARFPGLVYLVFVNRRPRADIMLDMQRRIQRGDVMLERRDGVQVSESWSMAVVG